MPQISTVPGACVPLTLVMHFFLSAGFHGCALICASNSLSQAQKSMTKHLSSQNVWEVFNNKCGSYERAL